MRAGAHAEGSARGQNGLHGRSGGLAGSSKTEKRTGLVRDERPGGQGEPFRGLDEGELLRGAVGLVFSRNTAAGGGEERHRGQQLGENGVSIKPGSSGFRQDFTQQQG